MNEIYKETILDEAQRDQFTNGILTRVYNLKQKSRMRDLNPKDIDHLISIQGIVIRCSEIYPEMKDALFRCTSCGNCQEAQIDKGRIIEPTICKRCQSRHSFELVHNLCKYLV